MSEAWAYIAHKDNHWAGIISGEVEPKELRRFFGKFAGFSITRAADRDDYMRTLNGMKMWRDHPEYKARRRGSGA